MPNAKMRQTILASITVFLCLSFYTGFGSLLRVKAAGSTIRLNPSANVFSPGSIHVGDTFSVTVWFDNLQATNVSAFNVYMEFNDSILRVIQWFEPTSDPQYIFYGRTTTAMPTPPDVGYVHLASGKGRVQVGALLFPAPPAQLPSALSGKLCIFQFNVTAIPPDPSIILYSALRIDFEDTFILDPLGMEVSGVVNEDGYYVIMVSPPPARFTVGDHVQTTANLRVREGPGLSYAILDTMQEGTLGQIAGGPILADSYVWWQVDYDVGVRGWSVESWLRLLFVNSPPVAEFSSSTTEPRTGEEVTLNASSSYDLDGKIISYQWDWDEDGDYDSYAGSSSTVFWWPEEGTYSVGLRVVDDTGAAATANKNFTVRGSAADRSYTIAIDYFDNMGIAMFPCDDTVLSGLTMGGTGISPSFSWPHPIYWWNNHKDLSSIDTWLREFDPNTKPLSWLSGSEFSWCEEADVVYVLNKVIDSELAPNLTFKTRALCAVNEERTVHEAWMQTTPTHDYLMGPLFKFALGSVWDLQVSQDSVLNLFGGPEQNLWMAGGVAALRLGASMNSVKERFKEIDKRLYAEALGVYSMQRYLQRPKDTAWWFAEDSVRLAIIVSGMNEAETETTLTATKICFEELWQKYDGNKNYRAYHGLPTDVRKQLRGQIKDLLLSALQKYRNELPNRNKAHKKCPIDLGVYDSENRLCGTINGQEFEEIPNSVYDNETGTVTVFLPSGALTYEAVGVDMGIYNLTITSVEAGNMSDFNAFDIPMMHGQTDSYFVNWLLLSEGEEGVMVEVDSDSNGTFEYNFTSDSELSRIEYVAATTQHDLGITGMTSTKSVVGVGYSYPINLTVVNYGVYTEIVNVTIYANATLVALQTVDIASGNSTAIAYVWNTTGFAKGNYTLTVHVVPVEGETYTADNTLIDGWVFISIPGDINGDRKVDVKDVYKVALAYGTSLEGPNPPDRTYEPNCDINGDDKIDVKDYYIVCKHYGETTP